ncbi:hypothetical protein [Hyunsoonleella rubra]|uniref:Uncharacterized protein n=1 Tax=Hyunsoonleella rubra TaxID=1737062 RepID=A0ABW5T8X8_9FLAO
MIKFFRRIRQKLLSENKFSKYLLYAIGEIVLVVIGILIALQINNQNELRKEQLITDKYLQGFVEDLTADKALLDTLIYVRNKQRVCAKALIESVERKEIQLDSFYNNYYYIFPFWKFSPSTNTMEEVLNSSQLRLITDETIKTKLLELRSLYSRIKVAEDHVYEHRAVYLYNHRTLDHIEFNGLYINAENKSFLESKDVEQYKKDAEYFLNDRYFKNFMNLLTLNLDYLIPLLEEAIKECNLILELIEND